MSPLGNSRNLDADWKKSLNRKTIKNAAIEIAKHRKLRSVFLEKDSK